jgi:probable HAF family extracellular repeat protein
MRSARYVATVTLCATLACCFALPAFARRSIRAQSLPVLSVLDIGGFGNPGGPSAAYAISNGLVVGSALTAGNNGQQNAVATRGAGLTDIGAGIYGTAAFAVNAGGIAAGEVFLPGPTQQRAVLFSGGREINLGVLPGDAASVATAINRQGVVVGTSTPSSGAAYVSQAFVYQNGTMSSVPQLSGLTGFLGANAQGVNDAGVVVGSVGIKQGALGAATSSYTLAGSTLTMFATVHGYANSQATAVNSSGIVAGYYSTFSFSVNAPLHAYKFNNGNGKFTDLGTLYPTEPYAFSVANAINSAGVVVGDSQQEGGASPPHATVFARGQVTDLNTLIAPNSGWLLETATGIDNSGTIVGVGLHNSIQRGFILPTGSVFTAH